MRRFLRNNGLSIVVMTLFLLCMLGQTLTGVRQFNETQRDHGRAEITLGAYLHTGHFLEVTAENWESEFLQMGFYIWLTSFLYQKGSSESKKLDEPMPVDRDPRLSRKRKNAPWAVRRGGWILRVYQYSLTLAFLLLFLLSFWLHAVGGADAYSADQLAHGGHAIGGMRYLGTSQFWFESLQNWQSEFLSLSSMVILSIFLRHKGSPESKPVDAPNAETGA